MIMHWKTHMSNQGHSYKIAATCSTCRGACTVYEELCMNKFTRFSKNDPVYTNRGLHKYTSNHETKFLRERKQRLIQEAFRPYQVYRIGT